jgi:hypothetical protein
MAFGVYPDISLAPAREKNSGKTRVLANGEGPVHLKKVKKENNLLDSQNIFQAVATEWFEVKMFDKEQGHKKRAWRILEIHLFPFLGISITRSFINVAIPTFSLNYKTSKK